ncbi:MAG: peptidase dimerization domain-containing protein, partial [Chloroflexales bacterium]|nr:peptidase dimerization domain-containing protein [Chloroflexales bacterium]
VHTLALSMLLTPSISSITTSPCPQTPTASLLAPHPWTMDGIDLESSLVAHGLEFTFRGRAAHAAVNPHEGINALDAMIIMFSSVGLLRQQIRPDARIHGVIINGGSAPNVIPNYTVCRFRVRASDPEYASALVERVIACAQAGAQATGATMEWHEYTRPYLNKKPNHALGAILRANLRAIGRDVKERRERTGAGSTDFGNVSHHIPTVCAYLGICGSEAGWHTKEVAEATRTERGHAAIIAGAKGLAMTALDVLIDEASRAQIQQEHRERIASERR